MYKYYIYIYIYIVYSNLTYNFICISLSFHSQHLFSVYFALAELIITREPKSSHEWPRVLGEPHLTSLQLETQALQSKAPRDSAGNRCEV